MKFRSKWQPMINHDPTNHLSIDFHWNFFRSQYRPHQFSGTINFRPWHTVELGGETAPDGDMISDCTEQEFESHQMRFTVADVRGGPQCWLTQRLLCYQGPSFLMRCNLDMPRDGQIWRARNLTIFFKSHDHLNFVRMCGLDIRGARRDHVELGKSLEKLEELTLVGCNILYMSDFLASVRKSVKVLAITDCNVYPASMNSITGPDSEIRSLSLSGVNAADFIYRDKWDIFMLTRKHARLEELIITDYNIKPAMGRNMALLLNRFQSLVSCSLEFSILMDALDVANCFASHPAIRKIAFWFMLGDYFDNVAKEMLAEAATVMAEANKRIAFLHMQEVVGTMFSLGDCRSLMTEKVTNQVIINREGREVPRAGRRQDLVDVIIDNREHVGVVYHFLRMNTDNCLMNLCAAGHLEFDFLY